MIQWQWADIDIHAILIGPSLVLLITRWGVSHGARQTHLLLLPVLPLVADTTHTDNDRACVVTSS